MTDPGDETDEDRHQEADEEADDAVEVVRGAVKDGLPVSGRMVIDQMKKL